MKKFFAYWFPLLVYSTLIFILSSVSLPVTPATGGVKSYFIHSIEFFVFAVLALRVLFHSKHPFLYSILFAILFGVLDEVHQYFVPGRTFSVLDMLFDSIGAVLVLVFMHKKMQVLLGLGSSSRS